MEELTKELKEEIIEALNLEEMTPEDIDENDALFGDGLGLDSWYRRQLLGDVGYGLWLYGVRPDWRCPCHRI